MTSPPLLASFQKILISSDGEIISNNLIASAFSEYLTGMLGTKGKNVGFIYHTGSSIFDSLLVVYTSIVEAN